MKIALLTNWYSENMGYSENVLPKALAQLGHEVHVISSTAQVYYNSPFYQTTYQPYLGSAIVKTGQKAIDNYTLHRLPFHDRGGIVINGLEEKLAEIRPDIVQSFDIDFNVYQVAQHVLETPFQLFTEMHLHASVFPNYRKLSLAGQLMWYWKIGRYLRQINQRTVLCYPIADDCADIAKILYKVPAEKIRIQSLGTDTQWFSPCETPEHWKEREHLRSEWGFTPSDIVCIYTGRITPDKGPSILARAVGHLQERGKSQFKALFVGIGQPSEMDLVRSVPGCVITDFVRASELPKYYRSADIGVWPLQESTSQLDAIACGLPLIVNDTVTVTQRVDGNGLFYRMGDSQDLARKLEELEDPAVRKLMGANGIKNAVENFSWIKLARERVIDYEASLQGSKHDR